MLKLPLGVDKESLIDDLRIFSWEASSILLYYAKILKDSNFKSNILENGNDQDPVTSADLKVNELIIKSINRKYRNVDWEILSEENVKLSSESCDRNADWVWVLDPLDGTKDFIQGTGNYVMHLALNYKKRPSIGVVLIPERDELWISNGEKLWCENQKGLIINNNISKKNKFLQDMVLVTSKNHINSTLQKLISKIDFHQVKIMGSIGCKVASLLRGDSDLYICLSLPGKSSPKDWDFAAPETILSAAGGSITDINNNKLVYGKSNFEQGGIIIASNNNLMHQKICLEIKEIIRKYDLYPI